jgi:hypothetical protein
MALSPSGIRTKYKMGKRLPGKRIGYCNHEETRNFEADQVMIVDLADSIMPVSFIPIIANNTAINLIKTENRYLVTVTSLEGKVIF